MLMVLEMLKCRGSAAGCSSVWGNDDGFVNGAGKTLGGC